MKFKINHLTRSVNTLRKIFVIFPILALIIFIALGFSVYDKTAFKIFIGIEIALGVMWIIFIVISLLEYYIKAEIIIESDHIIVKRVFRYNRIPFDKIIDVKTSRYCENERGPLTKVYVRHHNGGSYTYKRVANEINTFRVDFILKSGRRIILNDKIDRSPEAIQSEPYDPDAFTPMERTQLYKALQCYRSARAEYTNMNY